MKILNYTLFISILISVQLLAQEFVFPISVSDGIVSHNINIGLNENATDGYDLGLDVPAPPAPPAGSFDTRLTWQGNEFFTDIRDTSIVIKTFPISYSPATGQSITLYWDNSVVQTYGIFTIVDDPSNTQFILDMSTIDSLNVSTSSFIADSLKVIVNPGGLVGLEKGNELHPEKYSLEQNYPNPFNPITTIQYSISKSALVKLELFDIAGKKIKMLLNDYKRAGYHSLIFNGSDLASGVYFYKIQADQFVQSRKLLLIK